VTPAEVTIDAFVLWIAGLGTLVNFATVIWTIFSGPSRKNQTRLDEHTARLDRHEQRLQSQEQETRGMPSKDDMHKVQLSLTRLEGQFEVLNERLEPVKAISERMQEIMMHQDKRS
jgi:Protein of unknown function (DUF2730)